MNNMSKSEKGFDFIALYSEHRQFQTILRLRHIHSFFSIWMNLELGLTADGLSIQFGDRRHTECSQICSVFSPYGNSIAFKLIIRYSNKKSDNSGYL